MGKNEMSSEVHIMYIRLFSDLHLELANFRIHETDTDKDTILILAGDIGERGKPRNFIETCCKQFRDVIYVHGNHEYFSGEYFAVKDYWRQMENNINNLHFLDNDVLIIHGIRFLGTVLWTDMDNRDWFTVQKCKNAMREYHVVQYDTDWKTRTSRQGKPHGRLLNINDTMDMHDQARKFLIDNLQQKFDGKTIVITHHSPSHNFTEEMYRGSELNGGFHANCDDLFDYDIDYWFYGHTHFANSRDVLGTKFISNPRGYVGYENQKEIGFNPDFLLEI